VNIPGIMLQSMPCMGPCALWRLGVTRVPVSVLHRFHMPMLVPDRMYYGAHTGCDEQWHI
jgi:hypothetical protein